MKVQTAVFVLFAGLTLQAGAQTAPTPQLEKPASATLKAKSVVDVAPAAATNGALDRTGNVSTEQTGTGPGQGGGNGGGQEPAGGGGLNGGGNGGGQLGAVGAFAGYREGAQGATAAEPDSGRPLPPGDKPKLETNIRANTQLKANTDVRQNVQRAGQPVQGQR